MRVTAFTPATDAHAVPPAKGAGIGHIAILASPLPGHLAPLQVVGADLVARGWRVTVVHLADAARYVTQAGIGFAALPTQAGDAGRLDAYLATLADPTGPIGLPRMIRATAAMSAVLLDRAPALLAELGIGAVIADSVEPAATLVARRIGVPHVVAVTGLPLLREDDVPPPFLGWGYRADPIGRFRNRGGYAVSDRLMRPITRQLDAYRRDWNLAATDDGAAVRYVAQCPRLLDYPRRALPPGFGYGGPWRNAAPGEDMLPEQDGRPLVFCSLGTLQGSRHALFATMAAACAAIGARAVIGHGGGLSAAEEASLPGDPLVRAFWPQQAVLRHCAAAVLHGGFNTVLDALAAGVPIVALPIAFEQPATAARLLRIGAGRVLSPWRLGVGALAQALDRVMTDPGYRAATGRIAADMAQAGGAAAAAATISAALSVRP